MLLFILKSPFTLKPILLADTRKPPRVEENDTLGTSTCVMCRLKININI